MGHSEAPMPVIVVGVDETPASKAALMVAMREGSRRGGVIEVVTVWDSPPAAMSVPTSPEAARYSAQSIQDAAVAEALHDLAKPPLLSRQVVQGNPAEVLVKVARGADCLVVGTGRKGTLRRALLGSVSEFCVRRARCPVVVVPGPDELGATATQEFAQPA